MAAARDTRSNPTPKFSVGEKVLCYEPDPSKARVMYEAKVLEVDITKDDKGKKVPEYFIHFSGWNKSWDRWVMEDQVQKDSECNRHLMVKLHEHAAKAHKRKRKLSTMNSETKDSDSTGKMEREESDEQTEKSDLPKVEIEIPSQLKLKLEDDCYFVKRKKKLVQLPRKPNVLEVLEEYYEHCVVTGPDESKNLVRELVDGLRIYFDFTLPTLLLYNFEREQYRTVTGLSSDAPLPPMQSLDRAVTKDKDNDGVVSSSTESAVTKAAAIISSPCQTEPKEEAKSERTLRRRNLRSQLVEASQSSAVSSTSSSPERHAQSAPKTKSEDTVVRQLCTAAPQASTETASLSPLSPRLNLSASKMPSQVYGPEHLLRLFVKLPGLLARNNMEDKNLISLLEHVDDLLRYLADKSTTLFPEEVYFNALL